MAPPAGRPKAGANDAGRRAGGSGGPESGRPGLAPLGIAAAMRARDVSRPLDEPAGDQSSGSGGNAPVRS